MNKLLTILLMSLLTVGAVSCKRNRVKGKGETKTEDRQVGTFNAVHLSAPVTATIKVQPGAQASVQLNGYANILEKIKTEVQGNTLVIDKEGWDWDLDRDITATIVVPSLNALTISGAADADIQGDITTNQFDLKISGAGDVHIQSINASSFNTTLSGAGDLQVDGGNVGYVSYKVSGAGDIEAFPLNCKQAKASVSGAGDIDLTATEKLDVHVSGAGSVNYKGTPQVTSDINGIGSVEQVN